MLRRPATTITLTPEDIATYDDTRDQRVARLNHFWSSAGAGAGAAAAENVEPHHHHHHHAAGSTTTTTATTTANYDASAKGDHGGLEGEGGRRVDDGLRARRREEEEVRREREGRIMGVGGRR